MGGGSGFWRTHKVGWLLLAGLGCGLAMGSHYKGLLVGIVGLCGLLMDSALTRWQRGAMAALVSGLALLGFLLPNAVIFEQMDVFVSGLNHERSHALFGHFVPIYAVIFS
jgi:4-amino-4-deoxy-L-arabinose transferase-like glycosyltransferase